MAEAILPDGSVVKLPDFALEQTQAQMLATLKVLLKGDKESQELYEKFVDEVKKGNKEAKTADQKAQKVLEEIKKAGNKQQSSVRQKVADRIEGDVQGVFVGAGRAVSGLATAAVLATGAIIGFGAKIFTGLTDNLRDLTQAGLGFNEGIGQGAAVAIQQFNSLGYSTQEATQTMIKFASLTATLGRTGPGSLVNTMKSFKALTNNGLDLGMTFKEANEALLEELETRSSLGMLEGSVSGRQLAAANEQIKLQTAYASVLGISADKLREMNKQALSQNTGLVALASKFGNAVYEGAKGFNTAMAARGEQLGKLSELFLDAGAQSSVFISEAARELSSAGVGSITDSLIAFNDQLQGNTLTTAAAGQAAAMNLQNKLLRLGDEDVQKLQRVVEAGGAGAEMAKVIMLARREVIETQRKMEEVARRLGGRMKVDDLMNARIMFDNSIAEIKGAFDALMTSVMITFTPTINSIAKSLEKFAQAFKDDTDESGNKIRGIGTALIEGAKKIGGALMRLFGFEPDKLVDPDAIRASVVDKIDRFATRISKLIDDFSKFVDKFSVMAKDGSKSFDWSALFTTMGKNIAAGILNGIGDFLWALPGMLIDGVASFFSTPDPKAQADVGSEIANGVLKIVTFLFAVGAAKSIAAVLSGKIKDMAKGYVLGESAESLSKKRSGGLLDRLFPKPKFESLDGPGGPSAPGGKPGGSPAGPGKMDRIANGMKSLGSGIASLGVGIGRMLAAIGKGGAIAIASVFKGIATGVASLGKASVLKGVGVMTLLAAPVFLVGEAFKSWENVEWPAVVTAVGAIGALALVATAMGAGIKFVALGALAMAGLGLALQLFPVDLVQTIGTVLNTLVNTIMVNMPPIITAVGDALAKLVEVGAKGFDTVMQSVGTLLERINKLDGGNLLQSAAGIGAVGAALAALGAGSVVGGIGSFFGSLFGGGDPFDRLLKIADASGKFDTLSGRLNTLAGVMGETAKVIKSLDPQNLEKIVTEFTRLWKNLANVELNTKPYYDFAAISTEAMLKNADAINKIAAANKAQNLAYAEFIKLDEAKFAKNVQNAYNYNAANAGATEQGGLSQTVRNVFASLFGSKPATPVDPSKITPTTPTGNNVSESPLLNSLQTPVDKDSAGRTPAQILEQIERVLRIANTELTAIKEKV